MGMLPPFAAFLEENRAAVYRYLTARLARDEVDDCFQETFLSALRAYPTLPATANGRAWIIKIAERKALDRYRARRAHTEVSDTPDAGPSPDGYDPVLWRQVRDLPDKQRAAVLYRYVADLRYAQIADLMETSEEAARQNVRAALRTLRKVWQT